MESIKLNMLSSILAKQTTRAFSTAAASQPVSRGSKGVREICCARVCVWEREEEPGGWFSFLLRFGVQGGVFDVCTEGVVYTRMGLVAGPVLVSWI